HPDPAAVRALRRSLKLPDALCRLLASRGHLTPRAARSVLRPLLGTLHAPSGLLDAPKAARRLARAVSDREQVVVHGDFDADGIAAAALLASWIRALGGRADAIVPDRLRHGYDLSDAGVDRAAALGAAVLVTVDCGIVAHGPVQRAVRAGMDVIVTDHHRPGSTLPPAFAVVNPNRPGCAYPNKDLCGAAVAFKVGQLVAEELGRPADESWEYLDLVALATIADQMTLTGENRVLARYGLRAFTHSARPGLVALMDRAGVGADRPVDSAAVAFSLGPRINAAGRVGDASDALRLLMAGEATETRRLAETLEGDNRRRRELEQRTTEQALEALERSYDPERDSAVVVSGEGWHHGVIGIVASRLVERIYRPVGVLSCDGDRGRGSARSVPSFDLHAAISSCSQHLIRFGGHHQAAGMEIDRERLPAFREAFQAVARSAMGDAAPRPEIRADLEIGLGEAGPDLFRYLRYVGPFGQGNPDPVFVARGVGLAAPPKVLKGGHVKLRLAQDGASLPAIGFRLAERAPVDELGRGPVDVAFSLIESSFRGHTTIEAKVVDIRQAH
ncbi:MAG: single-stranded-DNA-specific exonuclease RecJ, partial [Gemmatimonadetes bacterium]|nr:single-stranded-DNA-specific exonuclease RecJ [Gemmatimonadota bacterium]